MIDRARYETYAFTALRIIAGAMFMCHGLPKLFGLWHSALEPGSQMWIGGVIELVTGLFIALGLFTRPAAFLASGTMAVAYMQFHWKGALGANFFPINNGGEEAVLYCFVFLWLWVRGAGPVSLDRKLGRSIAP